MRKKIISILLISVLAFSLGVFLACDNSNGEYGSDSSMQPKTFLLTSNSVITLNQHGLSGRLESLSVVMVDTNAGEISVPGRNSTAYERYGEAYVAANPNAFFVGFNLQNFILNNNILTLNLERVNPRQEIRLEYELVDSIAIDKDISSPDISVSITARLEWQMNYNATFNRIYIEESNNQTRVMMLPVDDGVCMLYLGLGIGDTVITAQAIIVSVDDGQVIMRGSEKSTINLSMTEFKTEQLPSPQNLRFRLGGTGWDRRTLLDWDFIQDFSHHVNFRIYARQTGSTELVPVTHNNVTASNSFELGTTTSYYLGVDGFVVRAIGGFHSFLDGVITAYENSADAFIEVQEAGSY